ncbi:protein translocase subunit SecD [Candidatus Fukatsuia anoeciicola]|uniref:protein translocase subunit SecD n=1 Tax=Candidatus Fukatsuia anoeciicola TaxID=2994492 RepID=UPI003464BB38
MLNHYPLWKYLALIFLLFISLLYALPNLYGEDPAVQITGTHNIIANETSLNQVRNLLEKEKIVSKAITLKKGIILICFKDTDAQLHAYETLMVKLRDKYIIALNLVPSTLSWLAKLGARPIKLGLDLRGGVHFLIEVDMNSVLNKLQEQNIDSLCFALRQKNIPYTSVSKFNNFYVNHSTTINFANSTTRDVAINYLSSHYNNLVISKNGSQRLKVLMNNEYLRKIRRSILQQNISVLRNRVNQLGVTEPLIQRQGANRIVIELPGIQDMVRAKEILGATATLEFRLQNTNVNVNAAMVGQVPSNSEVKNTREGQPIILYKRVILTGNHIINSTSITNEYNQAQVNILLDNEGGSIISNFTKDNIGRPMATLLIEYKNSGKKDTNGHIILVREEKVINVAIIQSRLGNNFCITGIANLVEAQQLSLLLRAGTLIAPIQIIEERTIGPALGVQNITQGLTACFCSLTTSIIFMVFYYRKFGLIASSALLINLVLIVGTMSLLPGATLTMPGIAGIVLTLAVAVDANVLINERIKEEISNGRSIQQAIHYGYKGAFSSIVDANIITLITAIILYTLTTGSIKGFAIATIIGVLTSMFTTIVGTRAIVNLLYGGKRINRLSI